MKNALTRWIVTALSAALLMSVSWQVGRLMGREEAVCASFNEWQSLRASKEPRDAQHPEPEPAATSETTLPSLSAWVTGLAMDRQNNLWVATEDRGMWRYPLDATNGATPAAFTMADGLGDNNIYAVACDGLGRIWAGHLNHGVSVYNGTRWRNYDVLDGPLGERVFCIKVNPVDGDVWMATSRGLTRYSVKQDTWSYYTRAAPAGGETGGLPSDQIQALAFDKDGTIYVGTQCDGLAICSPEKIPSPLSSKGEGQGEGRLEYRTWRVVHGASKLPLVPSGKGLPTDLINDVLVTSREGGSTVWVATTYGLAWSKNRGETWQFVRGQDWTNKVKGLYGEPPEGWNPTAGAVLAEDYVTCLAEDAASGKLWVGYRREGCGALDLATMSAAAPRSRMFVTAILPLAGESPLVGTYGDGLADVNRNKRLSYTSLPKSSSTSETVASTFAPQPSPAKAPTLAEMNTMLKELSSVDWISQESQPRVVALDDDWRTQGDWLGRYGRYWACLAGCAGYDYIWGAGLVKPQYSACIGPNHPPGDSVRRWIQWLKTADARCLEMPPVYLHSRVVKGFTTWDEPRRESEWDDHGEAFPTSMDGPHLYCTVKIPQGVFYLSLYDVNYNGHGGQERCRDYQISIRTHNDGKPLADIGDFQEQPELARSRIEDFYYGVWKRFLVRGPTVITIEVNRNYSFNTILPGVMLDLVEENPPPYFDTTAEEWAAIQADRQRILTANGPEDFQACTTESEAVGRLVEALQRAQRINPAWWGTRRSGLYAPLARWFGHRSPASLTEAAASRIFSPDDRALNGSMATVLYNCNLYKQWEECQKQQGLVPAREIEKALRWDEVRAALSGKGYWVVTGYMRTHGIKQKPVEKR